MVAIGSHYRSCEDRSRMSRPQRPFPMKEPTEFTEEYHNYSQIEPGLYVGGSILKAPPEVTAVLNLCEIPDPYNVKVHLWMEIPDDAPGLNIEWLKEATGFVADQRKKGRTVYVHCAFGINRSAMVSTAYLMKDRGWTRDEALKYIRAKRPQANPNPAFMDLLLEWEKDLADKK